MVAEGTKGDSVEAAWDRTVSLFKTHVSGPEDMSHNFCSNNQAEVYSLVPLTLILMSKYRKPGQESTNFS